MGSEPADKPALYVHLPPKDKANGAAVIVCPGGGYGHLAITYEGHEVAEWLNAQGVAGFVLKYRLAPRYHHPAPLADAQRALRTVRAERQGMGRRSGPYRHSGFLGRRTPGVDGRHAFRRGQLAGIRCRSIAPVAGPIFSSFATP